MAKRKKIFGEVKVVRYVHDIDNDTVQVRLRMVQYDKTVKIELIERALLREKGRLQGYLDPKPVDCSDADEKALRDARKIDPRKVELVATLPGWRSSLTAYAWPGRRFDEGKRKDIGFKCEPRSLLERSLEPSGDLARWLTSVCPAAAASSYAIFGQGVVFAGPLQPFSQASEGALFAFKGESGAGKTGICAAAQAIMGNPDVKKLPSWDSTVPGFRDLVAEVRHFTLVIDDTSRDERTDKQRQELSAYVGHLLSGGGKHTYAKVYEKAHGAARVRDPALGLTSGEMSTQELEALTGEAMLGGARVRFIDVPVPPPSKGGVFDRAVAGKKGRKAIVRTGRRAAKRLSGAIKGCNGVAFMAYLDYLTVHASTLEKTVQSIEARFVKLQHRRRRRATSSDLRIAEKFGLVLAGLLLAIKAGVVSFTPRQARRAVQKCFDAAMRGQDQLKRGLSRQIKRLRTLLGDDAQTPVLGIGLTDPGTLAFRRLENGSQVACMKLENLGPALDLDAAAVESLLKELLRRKLIQPGLGKPFIRPVQIGSRRSMRVVFTSAMLPPPAAKEAPATVEAPATPPARMVKNVLGEMVASPTVVPFVRRPRPRKPKWAGRPR